MAKANLAEELRQRQYKLGQVSKQLVDSLTDDQIIDSYITCSHCGEKQVDARQLAQVIADVENAEQFLAVCDAIANSESRISNCVEGILEEKGF